MPSPAPTAYPLTAAMVGLGSECNCHENSCPERSPSSFSSNVLGALSAAMLPTSPPRAKGPPGAGEDDDPHLRVGREFGKIPLAKLDISALRAFSLCGWFMVRTAMPSPTDT